MKLQHSTFFRWGGLLAALTLVAQQGKAQTVDYFTGGYSQSIDLLAVPSPDGPPTPINLNYYSGVPVMTPGSSVGMGWNLDVPASITRQVNGMPDDWYKMKSANLQDGDFQNHYGSMYTLSKDWYVSEFKLDTPFFYFPDYDTYVVSSPGVAGSMRPFILDFLNNTGSLGQVTTGDTIKHLFFALNNDFSDTLESRHYKWEDLPVDAGDTFYKGEDVVDGSVDPFEGGAYVDSRDRLKTSHYVEFFTNKQIYDHYEGTAGDEIPGFIDFEEVTATSDRTNTTEYDTNGIGAFRIYAPGGMVYHFSLPVYSEWSQGSNRYLDKDWNPVELGTTVKSSGYGSWLVKEADSNIVEFRLKAKIANQWLLVAVTGPNYSDVNDNNVVDEGDLGYWVKYDWQKWCDDFQIRYPNYGFVPSFTPYDDYDNANMDIADADKVSGKFGSYSLTSKEVYYLNSVITASHTAVIVRDIRLDEHSSPYYYDEQYHKTVNQHGSEANQDLWFGKLYDSGGPTGYIPTDEDITTTIAPEGADRVRLDFISFDLGETNIYDTLFIYDGEDANATLIGAYREADSIPDIIYSTGSSITIRLVSDDNCSNCHDGFELDWRALWDNELDGWTYGRPKVVPQLSTNRIILFDNDDLDDIDTVEALTTHFPLWDLDTTTADEGLHYHVNWYNDNKHEIDPVALKTIELNQDYSLAPSYYGNIACNIDSTFQTDTPDQVHSKLEVATNYTANSGKLTLNEVTIYEEGYTQVTPSYLFDYNASDTLDNPEFDPRKQDYWGFYKIDADGIGYGGYATDSSDAYVDAWCLRQVTMPLGNTIDIAYEANQYEKVIEDSIGGGFRGAHRTYWLQNVLADDDSLGGKWTLDFETDSIDFWTRIGNLPTGATSYYRIPFKSNNATCVDPESDFYWHAYGSGTWDADYSTVADTGLYEFGSSWHAYPVDGTTYTRPDDYFDIVFPGCDSSHIAYTGQGYIYLQYPVGETLYGGGIRTASITVGNGTDSYVTEYEYLEGVATAEASWFDRPRWEADHEGQNYYALLAGATYDQHQMAPQVGYSEVRVKNMGQVNSNQGVVAYTFITSDEDYSNYEATAVKFVSAASADAPYNCIAGDNDTSYVINVDNQFVGAWGRSLTTEVTDVNGNIISLKRNYYDTPVAGSTVELFNVTYTYEVPHDPGEGCPLEQHKVCIKRDYPLRLIKQEDYAGGQMATTEYLEFDPITGAPTVICSHNPTARYMLTESTPAYTLSQYADMGPMSEDSTNTNQINAIAATKTIIDSTLTHNTDFGMYTVETWNDTVPTLRYSSTAEEWQIKDSVLTYWLKEDSYSWVGPLGEFGLYDDDSLVAFDFDFDAAQSDHWRFGGVPTLYDQKGHVLETKLYNDRYASAKYGYGGKYQTTAAPLTTYGSFTYTGFEDLFDAGGGDEYFSGEFILNDGDTVSSSATVPAHTGDYVLKVTNTASTYPMYSIKEGADRDLRGLQTGRVYHASVWVHQSSLDSAMLVAELDGNYTDSVSVRKDDTTNIQVGEWILMQLDITVPEDYESSGGTNNDLRFYLTAISASSATAYFDDFRFHPLDVSITGTVTDPDNGLTMATLDANNFATIYEYDAAGRVTKIFKELEGYGLKLMTKNTYNYARSID